VALVPSAASSGRVFVAKLLADTPPPAPTELACHPPRVGSRLVTTARLTRPTLQPPRSTLHAPRATPHSSPARARPRAVLLYCRLAEPLHQAGQHRRHAARDALELVSVVPRADVHREQQVPSGGHFRTLAAALRQSLWRARPARRRCGKRRACHGQTRRAPHHRGRARAGQGSSVGRGSWAWGVSSGCARSCSPTSL
jgi:hypothetical protein